MTIKIIVDEEGNVSLEHEPKTAENIKARLDQFKELLGTTWYGVVAALGMKPTEGNVRLLRRWVRDPSMASFQEMPDSQWKFLLMLLEGQPKPEKAIIIKTIENK